MRVYRNIVIFLIILILLELAAIAYPFGGKENLRVLYGETEEYNEERILIEGEIEKSLEKIEENFELDEELQVVFKECGEANAFYFPESKKIIMCYELGEELEDLFGKFENKDESEELVKNTYSLIFYNEIAKAIFDSKEFENSEENVLRFATYISVVEGKQAKENILRSAIWFYTKDFSFEEIEFFKENNFDSKKFYDFTCQIYGSDFEEYYYLTEARIINEKDKLRCREEFNEIENEFWNLSAVKFK